jgi:PAS domain S-box-containing protein
MPGPRSADELVGLWIACHEYRHWCAHVSDGSDYTEGAVSVTIATIALQHEHDLIVLRRRLRAVADEQNFDWRDVGRLSTAAYEAARQLYNAQALTTAELRVARDGGRPSLRIVIAASAHDESGRRDLRRRLESSSRHFDGLVDRLAIEPTAEGVSITLTTFPAGGPETRADVVDRLSPPDAAGRPDGNVPREQYENLQHALRDMQVELQETNRGVVAIYAELDDQTDRLRHAEDRLRTLLDSVHDYAICMLGADGEIVSWNAGAQRLFGFEADEIIGRNYACFFPPIEREDGAPEAHLEEARVSGRHEVEGQRVRRGGSVFEAHVLITPMSKGPGHHRGFSLVIRDITERTRLEDDLRRRAEELEAANRAKEDFLATLSHELRTPLNAMLGWTRLLRMGRLDDATMTRALETIERSAHIQEQLISDILDVSRVVTGKLRLNLRPLELSAIIDAAVDAVRPTAEAKGITLDCQIEATGSVLGDGDRLQQVLWNLFSNAIKFTPRGGRVTISSGRVGANATIKVVDTGEGMAPELLPFVFDRFRQGDGSSTRPHGGLGLGLSIVRHIVELHGGQTQAWSEGANRGSTFQVQLPVRAVQKIEEAADLALEPPLAGLKVLVVDDEPDAREIVSTALAQCGARTAAVASAREAMQMIADFRPDVVVSDVAMPGEDGYSLVRRIRGLRTQLANVPIVALTAFTQPDDRRRALRAGFRHFVPKPVEIDELAAVVRTVVDQR